MKKIIALLTCILLVTSVTYAQKDSTRYAREKTRVKNMDTTRKQNLKDKGITKNNVKDLDLSKDQEKQIDNIHSNARQEKEKINNDNSLTPEQKQEKIKEVDRTAKSKTNSVLTPDQRQKMKDKRMNAKKKNGE
jgi:Spy/CpxP family protein refolding chaperone